VSPSARSRAAASSNSVRDISPTGRLPLTPTVEFGIMKIRPPSAFVSGVGCDLARSVFLAPAGSFFTCLHLSLLTSFLVLVLVIKMLFVLEMYKKYNIFEVKSKGKNEDKFIKNNYLNY
jgi:hypothetical protein